MKADHIFIFSNNQGNEANELLDFGLVEGSNRIHPGQGTRNRKFYFKNFYLEILWVTSENEIKSHITAPTGLWQRANFKNKKYSPFGLCLEGTAESDELFKGCLKYQPVYLPAGMAIDVITNQNDPHLPWTFRWPFAGPIVKAEEPTDHQVDIKELTQVKFKVPEVNFNNDFTDFLSRNSNVAFEYGEQPHLVLEFDKRKQGLFRTFEDLSLTIAY